MTIRKEGGIVFEKGRGAMISKICLIGSSGHVGYVFDSLRGGSKVEIVGVAPGSEGESMDRVMAECHALGQSPRLETDFRSLLDTCKPDAAVIACHFADHARVAIEVLSRRIPIFLEKPFATSFEDLARLREAYEGAKVFLMPMLALRYEPAFLAAWNYVQEGGIGEVRLLSAQKSYRLGTRPPFYRSRSRYGGTIPWVGSHAIDWILWFSQKKPISIYATHSRYGNRGHGDLEVTALCLLRLADEISATIQIDYLRPEQAPTHEDDRLRVVGTKNTVEVAFRRAILATEGEPLPLPPPRRIFDDFLGALRGEATPLCNAEDGFRVTDVALRARQAADEDRILLFP